MRPTLNGYIDRVVFADKCGYVYKIDPGVDLSGDWYQNTGMGTIAGQHHPRWQDRVRAVLDPADGRTGCGADRAIAGTIAARTDSTTRMVLLFGTGGIESVPSTSANAFFAVYADTGAIRSKVLGACTAGNCEKFYGGVVVTPQQVLFTKTVDPAIGTNACDSGSSTISGVDLNPGTGTNFTSNFNLAVNSAVMGGLFGDAGAIYFATISGDVARIGTPRVVDRWRRHRRGPEARAWASATRPPADSTVGTTSGFTLMGWRVVM